MAEKNNKKIIIILISIFVLVVVLSFVAIKIFQKKQNIALENHFINVRLITSVHPSLPWKFSTKEPNIKIKPGEVKTIEYIVENPSNKTTFGVATFQYHPKELGNYFTKLNCFCFDKQTLKAGENNKYSLVILIDPEVTKDSKTKDIKEVIMQFTFFDYDEFKKGQT